MTRFAIKRMDNGQGNYHYLHSVTYPLVFILAWYQEPSRVVAIYPFNNTVTYLWNILE